MLVWLVTALALAAEPAIVSVDGHTWADLQVRAAAARVPRVRATPTPWVSRRDVVVQEADAGVRVTWTWTWTGVAPAVVDVPVPAGVDVMSVSLDGAPWGPDPAAPTVIRVPVIGRAVLQVVGRLDQTLDGPVSLALGPGSGRVFVPAGRVVASTTAPVVRVRDGWMTSAASVIVSPAPPPADDRARALATGRVDLGLTVRDADVAFVADVTWLVRRGRVSTVQLDVPFAGVDLTVEGPVASWTRVGDTVSVLLEAPSATSVPLRLRWTVARRPGEPVTLPRVVPQDVVSTERSLVVARDTDEEVVPRLTGGTTLYGDALVRLGALVSGTPSAARSGDVAGSIDVFSFVPAERPPLVVDVADWFIAATSEGRALLQGTLSLRNERAAALTVQVPDGARLLAVQVDGVPVTVSDAGAGRWRVALPRSVETMRGLLAFPVELTVLATHEGAWVDEGAVRVRLPTVDADVAVRHVTLQLPRDARLASGLGEHGRVEAFSEGEGLSYGFGEGVDEARAGALYREALDAWMDNDFEVAQERLDDLRSIGAENENVGRLQSNLDMVGGALVDGDEALERRLKDQARSRALDVEREQAEVLRYADDQAAAGNVEEASEAYATAERVTRVLEALEQDEGETQVRVAAEVKAKKEAVARQSVARGPMSPSLSVSSEEPAVVGGVAGLAVMGDAVAAADEPAPSPDPVTGDFDQEVVRPQVDRGFDGATVTTPVEPKPSPSPSPVAIAPQAAPTVPVGRAYNDVLTVAPGAYAESVYGDGPLLESTIGALTVTGTSASVIVPSTGETVRFQHLLIPPGTDVPVVFRVDLPRRSR